MIAQLKKQYWDARHNCSAYVIGDTGHLLRCSDDGEPQGTAGRPMLDVLLGEHLVDVCAVVTRYFGGTLLGTGGLVRAYTDAMLEALAGGTILGRVKGLSMCVRTDYNDLGKVQYLLNKEEGVIIRDTQYTDTVSFRLLLPEERAGSLKAAVTEGTAARAQFLDEESCLYAVHDGEAVIL